MLTTTTNTYSVLLDRSSIHLTPEALGALSAATEPSAINAALAHICVSLDMHRYVAIRTQGVYLTRVTQVLHNVPEREAGPLEAGTFWSSCTELHGLLKGSPPFVYGARDKGAPFIPAPGFTSGAAAASPGSRDATILLLGRPDPSIKSDNRAALRAFTLLAATYLSEPMARLPSAACPLTDRQLDCVRLAAPGRTSKQVATLLGISFRTVDTLLAQARTRLGVDSTFEVGMAALDYGWISLEEVSETKQQAAG